LQRASLALDRLDVRVHGKLLVFGVATGLLALFGHDARADAQSDLEKAHSAYVAHKYGDAEARLRALLDDTKNPLTDPDSIADARMYLGAVLVAEGRKDEAGRVFEQLVLDKPDYEPDSLRVSLDAIDAFIDARKRLRDRLVELQAEQVRKLQEQRAKEQEDRLKAATRLALLEKLASTEVVTERHSRWLALLPFGAGQFQNGQETLGWMFLSGETILGVTSIGAVAVALSEQLQANDAFARRDLPEALSFQRRAQIAAIVADWFAAGFYAAAVGGIVHAQLTFVPERVETRKREIPPVSLEPFVGPGIVGVSGQF
jgi:TolA-binding protein